MVMENKWRYGGREFAFDIGDCESMKRLCDAMCEIRGYFASVSESSEHTAPAESMLASCRAVRRFFDSVLDEGSEGVFGGGMNMREHIMAYADFIKFVESEIDSFKVEMSAMGARYLERAAAYGE